VKRDEHLGDDNFLAPLFHDLTTVVVDMVSTCAHILLTILILVGSLEFKQHVYQRFRCGNSIELGAPSP
jgi:hypothetical protein